MKRYIVLLLLLVLTSCATPGPVSHDVVKVKPPQLWSHHKKMNISAESCALKGLSALKSLGFSGVIQNGTYVYGNFHDNRAVVKCVSVDDISFLYLAVAGPSKEVVEKLRNEIAWKM